MKYDKEHIDIIIASLNEGDGRVRACQKANISYQCFLDWMENKIEFSESVKKAEINGNDKIKDICKRRIIEDKSWQSAAWWLERNYKTEFASRTDITSGGEPLKAQIIVQDKETSDNLAKLQKQ